MLQRGRDLMPSLPRVSAQVQINNNLKNDTFTELPVSLVLFSLICIDVVERIRQCRLTGQGKTAPRSTAPQARPPPVAVSLALAASHCQTLRLHVLALLHPMIQRTFRSLTRCQLLMQ